MIQSAAHFLPRHTDILQTKKHLIHNGCGDKLILWILKNKTDLLMNLRKIRWFCRIQALKLYSPFSWQQQSVHELCNSGFARTIRPDYRHKLPCFYRKANILQERLSLFIIKTNLIEGKHLFTPLLKVPSSKKCLNAVLGKCRCRLLPFCHF
ncbi:hypothetical protein D3C75_450060 [compost metagenome]